MYYSCSFFSLVPLFPPSETKRKSKFCRNENISYRAKAVNGKIVNSAHSPLAMLGGGERIGGKAILECSQNETDLNLPFLFAYFPGLLFNIFAVLPPWGSQSFCPSICLNAVLDGKWCFLIPRSLDILPPKFTPGVLTS